MSVMIRLSRHGGKKTPYYHVVATPKANRRDGEFLAKLGTFNPLFKDIKEQLKIDLDAFQAWVAKGAQPSQTVRQLVKRLSK